MSKTPRRVYKIAAAAAFTAGSVAAIPATFAAEAPADQSGTTVAVTQHRAVVQHSELGGLAFERCHHAIGLDDVASVVEVSEQSPALLVESGGGPAVGLSDPSREVVDEDVDPSGARILDHAGVDDRRTAPPRRGARRWRP